MKIDYESETETRETIYMSSIDGKYPMENVKKEAHLDQQLTTKSE